MTIGLVLACFFLTAYFSRSFADYPINDDWAYGRAIFTSIKTGQFVFPGWSGATFVALAAWAISFCKVMGSTFMTLHFSGFTLALISIVVVYKYCLYLSKR